jgi:NADH dehydrogenase
VPYDTLVMALGSTSNDFNTPGVKENCIFLDNPHQARRFHQEMLNLFLKYSANLGANGKVNIAMWAVVRRGLSSPLSCTMR